MKFTLSVLAMVTLAAAIPAHATVYTVGFSGTVYSTQGATGRTVGSTVSGQFNLDSITSSFLNFTIDGKSVASGYQSFATIIPAQTDALYTAQTSPVATGLPSNSSFSLDLSSLTTWPPTDTAFTLLTDTNQLATNLDLINRPSSAFPSTFQYYTANADGTNIVALRANLTSLTTSAVPEPSTFALLGSSLLLVGAVLRRRRV